MKTIRKIGSVLYRVWMAFARGLAVVNTTILLSIVYFILIGPMALVARILRKDPLGHRQTAVSAWKDKEPLAHTLEQSRHQF
ncbi:MAG: SxtJ family membrane protein [Bacteroidota bacterium]